MTYPAVEHTACTLVTAAEYEQTVWELDSDPVLVSAEYFGFAGRFFGIDPWDFGFLFH